MSEEETSESMSQESVKGKKGRRSGAIYFPRDSLEESLRVPKAIWEFNAGNPFTLLELSKKLNCSATSSGFAELLRSSQRYGLTEGSFSQDVNKIISLTSLGNSIVAPTSSDNINANMRKALETPRVFKKIFASMDGRIIPPADVLKNTLIRDCHLPQYDAEPCYNAVMKNIEELGLIQEDGKGKKHLQLSKLGLTQRLATPEQLEQPSEVVEEDHLQPPPKQIEEKQIPKQIFIAHGKNKKPLDQLTKILQKYKIPHVVANDEPHKGRPIGLKVAEEMKKCTAGIFVFTGDEETKDNNGTIIMRPSDNVVYELGAGSVLYSNKIIILREKGVEFASDFTEFGRITFEKDNLEAKGLEIMAELAGLDIITFSVTG